MSPETLKVLITMICYMLIVIGIGLYFAKRAQASSENYFLGGRSLGPWVAAMSAEASDMSGWLLMGLPVCFDDLDLGGVSKERFYDWCVGQCYPGNNMEHHNFDVTPKDLFDAMMLADKFGKARKAALGK